jgi:hypothetical protein
MAVCDNPTLHKIQRFHLRLEFTNLIDNRNWLSKIMAPEGMAAVLWFPNQLCCCVCFFALFVTYFVHNVSATVSYDWKELVVIRTVTTHPILEEYFFFHESDGKDLLQMYNHWIIKYTSYEHLHPTNGT